MKMASPLERALGSVCTPPRAGMKTTDSSPGPWREAPFLHPAEGKLASGTEGFLAMSQVEKQLVSQGESGISEYTRVNIECEKLLISRTKAVSINERCPFAVSSNHFLGPGSLAMAQCCCESCMTL